MLFRSILFDAVEYGAAPAALVVARDEQVPGYIGSDKMSLHQAGVNDVLACVQLMGKSPERLTLIGIQPVQLEDYGGTLTDAVRSRIDEALSLAIAELDAWGTSVKPRSPSPGNGKRNYWSGAAAAQPGSDNYMGIKDPVVDALIERVIFATSREDLVTATHALDRVLLWGYHIVPQWYRSAVWIAHWDKFGIPDKQPGHIGVDIDSWWIDPEREAALAAAYRRAN